MVGVIMGYKKPGYIRQAWWVVKYAIHEWFEWQDAKAWAKVYRPAWLAFAKRANSECVRNEYKRKILMAYRGMDYA